MKILDISFMCFLLNLSDRFSILKNICLDKNMTEIGLIWPEIFNFKVCAILRIYAIFT